MPKTSTQKKLFGGWEGGGVDISRSCIKYRLNSNYGHEFMPQSFYLSKLFLDPLFMMSSNAN